MHHPSNHQRVRVYNLWGCLGQLNLLLALLVVEAREDGFTTLYSGLVAQDGLPLSMQGCSPKG